MMVLARLILATVWLCLVCPVSWSCLPCDLVTCGPLYPRQCNYREPILDPKCGCCPVCSPERVLVQKRCGGETDQCETGLICRYRPGNVLGIQKTGMCEPGEVNCFCRVSACLCKSCIVAHTIFETGS